MDFIGAFRSFLGSGEDNVNCSTMAGQDLESKTVNEEESVKVDFVSPVASSVLPGGKSSKKG